MADDSHLRHVEKEVMIPKIMREKAKENCKQYVKAFEDCCRGRTVSVVWSCRKENDAMKQCMATYFKDPNFYERCQQEYLKERKEFRESGVRKKHRHS